MYAESAVTVRRPTEDDVQALAELMYRFYSLNEEFDPLWATAPNLKELAAEEAKELVRSQRDLVLVAVRDSKVVGYVRASLEVNRLLRHGSVLNIKELYVRPEERRLGVATMLVERVIDEARKAGLRYVSVEFPSANAIAQEMYAKIGFRPYLVKYLREV